MLDSGGAITPEVETLADSDFIALVSRFDALQTLEEKVRFLIENSWVGEGFIIPVTRKINGESYSYGFTVQRIEEAEEIAGIMHTILKETMFAHYIQTFPARLGLCGSDRERINLLEAEKAEQTRFLNGDSAVSDHLIPLQADHPELSV